MVSPDRLHRHVGEHTVYYEPPRFLCFVVRGDLSGQDIEEMAVFVTEQVAGQPYLVGIVNVSGQRDVSPDARKASARTMAGLPYRALAFVGANFQTRIIARLVLGAIRLFAPGRSFPTAFFDTEEQARAWLAGYERNVPIGRAAGM